MRTVFACGCLVVPLVVWSGVASAQTPLVPVREAWVRHYPDVDTCDHAVTAMAVDGTGNVYVTGYGKLPGRADYDFLTKEINSSGLTVWEARYDGTGHGYDEAVALRIDASGNVYVVGTSVGAGTSEDFVTIKYDAHGGQQWIARYNGPGDGSDLVSGMAIDGSGGVAVFGSTSDSSGNHLSAVVKYTSAGAEDWRAIDTLYGLEVGALDRLGNVYVSGYGSSEGYQTIKYGSNGIRQWKRIFRPTIASYFPSSLAVDETGSVYVTGDSEDLASGDSFTWVVSYNSAGVQQWYKQYGPVGQSILLLDSTLVYLNAGHLLIALTRGGAGVWTVNCALDSVYDIAAYALNKLRNFVVIGWPFQNRRVPMASYSLSGAKLWARQTQVSDPVDPDSYFIYAALDSSGGACVSLNNRSSIYNPFVTRIDSSGNHLWSEPAQNSLPTYSRASVMDGAGNLIVIGGTFGAATGYDYLTIKYDSFGAPLWGARYDGPASSNDSPVAVATDLQGNIYVTGGSIGPGTGWDYATIKYDAAGQQQWVARYDGPASLDDIPSAISLDSLGYIYVTGMSEGMGRNRDYATVKYTPLGVQQWAARYDGPSAGHDSAASIAVDAVRNVYVTGVSDSAGTGPNIATIKYNEFGQRQWVRQYNSPADGVDSPSSLAVDPAGNIRVSGVSDGAGTQQDFVTISYNSKGVQQWAVRYDDSAHSSDVGKAMAMDQQGSAFVTGFSTGGGNAEDYVTVKYDANGVSQWVATYDGSAHGTDIPTCIAVDDAGNAYVTGQSYNGSGGYDIVTLRYNSGGPEAWRESQSMGGSLSVFPTGIAIDRSENVYVSGSNGFGTGNVWIVIKYVQSPTLAVRDVDSHPLAFNLEQNYPNPFNPTTTIRYAIPHRSHVTLTIYNTLGQQVAILINGEIDAGYHEVKFDAAAVASGVYFYRLQAGSLVKTKKLLLVH